MIDKLRPESSNLSIVLFFTKGISLRYWDEAGLFEREVALYRRLQSCGVKVTFITYGDGTDLCYQNRIPGISICCNRWNIPDQWYAKLIPWLHLKALKATDLVKTNQMQGAEIAMAAAQCWHKPLLARCGYMWSDFKLSEHGADSIYAKRILEIENKVFHAADAIVVTTSMMKASITNRYVELNNKIQVIPNYVDTDMFAPAAKSNHDGRKRLCFIGRLDPQKNVQALIEAVSCLDVHLDIIGQGSLYDNLILVAASNRKIKFLGAVPHKQLPDLLKGCAAFAMPSFYEGHPKALIEAMACGLPVIGTDVPGINDVIRHGQNGWLCKTDPESIRKAIQEVLNDEALRTRLGCNARIYAVENYALGRVVDMELNVYRRIEDKGR